MTDSTGFTDGPDNLLGQIEDTPGPEATPEQDAFVASLLGSLRADDPAMPDDVVRRLDAVLAEERRRPDRPADVAASAGLSAVPPLADPADADRRDLPANVTVLPARDERERRGPSTRSFKLVTGIAAATVLVAGAAAVSSGVLGGSASDTSGGATTASAVIQDSGTAYSSKSLDSQAERLVGEAYSGGAIDGGGAESPEVSSSTQAAATGTPDPRISPPDAAPAAPVTAESLDACIEKITEGGGGEPLLVDQGTYDGRQALVIVLPALDAERAVDVWVVTAPCDAASGEVVDFRRVDAP